MAIISEQRISTTASALLEFGPLYGALLNDAREAGAESYLLHRIQEQALLQLVYRCQEAGIDPALLSATEVREMMDALYHDMLNGGEGEQTLVSYLDVTDCLEFFQRDIDAAAAQVCERVSERALTLLHTLDQHYRRARDQHANRRWLQAIENGFLSAARELGSIHRLCSVDVASIEQRLRDDPALREAPLLTAALAEIERPPHLADSATRRRSLIEVVMGREQVAR